MRESRLLPCSRPWPWPSPSEQGPSSGQPAQPGPSSMDSRRRALGPEGQAPPHDRQGLLAQASQLGGLISILAPGAGPCLAPLSPLCRWGGRQCSPCRTAGSGAVGPCVRTAPALSLPWGGKGFWVAGPGRGLCTEPSPPHARACSRVVHSPPAAPATSLPAAAGWGAELPPPRALVPVARWARAGLLASPAASHPLPAVTY